MMRGWEDLVARASGLTTRLLGRSHLGELARLRDLPHLAAALDEAYGPTVGLTAGASADQLEIAVRRAAARHLRILARWSGNRVRCLAPVLLDEDRRSIRALMRGTAAGSPPSERMAGLIPTPTVPEKALEELARQASPGHVAALLVAWGHPFGAALLEEARRPRPDLLRLDLLLNAEYARRSLAAVRGATRKDAIRRDLATFVQATVDVENASTAMQLAAQRSSIDRGILFIPDGRWLDRATFLIAAGASSAAAATATLSRAFRGTPLARMFDNQSAFEDAALSAQLRWTTDRARLMPLGAAPVIAFLVRLRAEVHDLRHIIWRIALGAPPLAADALLSVT